MNTIDLSNMSDCMNYIILKSDFQKIIEIFNTNNNNNDFACEFSMKKGMYKDSQIMYRDIILVINELHHSEYILELMPLIDDYLEIFFD